MTSGQIREARLRFGLSQNDMALLLGMGQGHYSRLETGYEDRRPTKQHTAQVAVLDFIFTAGLLPRLVAAFKTQKEMGE